MKVRCTYACMYVLDRYLKRDTVLLKYCMPVSVFVCVFVLPRACVCVYVRVPEFQSEVMCVCARPIRAITGRPGPESWSCWRRINKEVGNCHAWLTPASHERIA